MFAETVYAHSIPRYDFHWEPWVLEEKNSVSWAYCHESPDLEPKEAMRWRSVLRLFFFKYLTAFFRSFGGFFCIPRWSCILALLRTSLRRWIYFGAIMWKTCFFHASFSPSRSSFPRSKYLMSSSLSVSKSWLVEHIGFSGSDVEDGVGWGLVYVGIGSI